MRVLLFGGALAVLLCGAALAGTGLSGTGVAGTGLSSTGVAGTVPGTGFIITGEGDPVVDMSVVTDVSDNVAQAKTEICRSVAAMRGSDTVYSAEYVEGVDAYGRAVVPADVENDAPQIVPDKIDIPVRVDVLKAIGIASYDHLDMLPTLGTMTVFKEGRVFFNGRDLTPDFQVICNP